MINCSLILKKDTYCPHMQETPLLCFSLIQTLLLSVWEVLCFAFSLCSSLLHLFYFSSVVHSHTHASHHSVFSAWNSMSSRYFLHRKPLLTCPDWILLQTLPHIWRTPSTALSSVFWQHVSVIAKDHGMEVIWWHISRCKWRRITILGYSACLAHGRW